MASISDKAKRDALNGIYKPPVSPPAKDHEVHLYDRVWDLYTQKAKGLS